MSMFKGHAPIIAVGSDDSNSTGPKVLVYEFSETGRRWIRVESIMTINDAVSGELY
jgi:nucleoporin SEH1